VLSHADLALAEASRAVFQQHLLVLQHLQRHFLLDGTLFQIPNLEHSQHQSSSDVTVPSE
jgi:hypothetical protein